MYACVCFLFVAFVSEYGLFTLCVFHDVVIVYTHIYKHTSKQNVLCFFISFLTLLCFKCACMCLYVCLYCFCLLLSACFIEFVSIVLLLYKQTCTSKHATCFFCVICCFILYCLYMFCCTRVCV